MHAANDVTYLLELRIFNLISFPPIPRALIVYRAFGAKRTRVYRTSSCIFSLDIMEGGG